MILWLELELVFRYINCFFCSVVNRVLEWRIEIYDNRKGRIRWAPANVTHRRFRWLPIWRKGGGCTRRRRGERRRGRARMALHLAVRHPRMVSSLKSLLSTPFLPATMPRALISLRNVLHPRDSIVPGSRPLFSRFSSSSLFFIPTSLLPH